MASDFSYCSRVGGFPAFSLYRCFLCLAFLYGQESVRDGSYAAYRDTQKNQPSLSIFGLQELRAIGAPLKFFLLNPENVLLSIF